jgi:hypothetical protein
MHVEEFVLVVVALVSMCFTVCYIAKLWFNRSIRKASGQPSLMPDERLARIEQAVDTMALEVERISEGQRYLTRVLASRPLDTASLPVSTGTPSRSS